MSIFKNPHTKIISILIGAIFFANSTIAYAIEGPRYKNNLRVPSSFSQSSTNSDRIEEGLGLVQQRRPAKKSGFSLYVVALLISLFSMPDVSFPAQEAIQAFSRKAPINSQPHASDWGRLREMPKQKTPGRDNLAALMHNMSLRSEIDNQFFNEIQRLRTLRDPGGRYGFGIWLQRLIDSDAIRDPDFLFDVRFQDNWDRYLSLVALGDTESVFRLKNLVKAANNVNTVSEIDKKSRRALHDSLRNLDVTVLIAKANKGDLLAKEDLRFLDAEYSNPKAGEALKALKKQGQNLNDAVTGGVIMITELRLIADEIYWIQMPRLETFKYMRNNPILSIFSVGVAFDASLKYLLRLYLNLVFLGDAESVLRLNKIAEIIDTIKLKQDDAISRLELGDSLRNLNVTALIAKFNKGDSLAQVALRFLASYYNNPQAREALETFEKQPGRGEFRTVTFDETEIREGLAPIDPGAGAFPGYKGIFFSHKQVFLSL